METDVLYILVSATAAILVAGFLATLVVMNRLQELHLTMNSRLSELLDATKKLARAEGFRAGQEDHLSDLRDAAKNLPKSRQ